MSSENSFSNLVLGLQRGDDSAIQLLWEKYFDQLVRLARRKLAGAPRRMADEEDVALSALNSFCNAVQHGRFPRLADRDDLWRVLMRIAANKAFDQAKYERRQKRGGGQVLEEAALAGDDSRDAQGLAQVVGHVPTPEFASMMFETTEEMLRQLDAPLRRLAELKLQGCTNIEASEALECSLRTVERRLGLIRQIWSQEGDA